LYAFESVSITRYKGFLMVTALSAVGQTKIAPPSLPLTTVAIQPPKLHLQSPFLLCFYDCRCLVVSARTVVWFFFSDVIRNPRAQNSWILYCIIYSISTISIRLNHISAIDIWWFDYWTSADTSWSSSLCSASLQALQHKMKHGRSAQHFSNYQLRSGQH